MTKTRSSLLVIFFLLAQAGFSSGYPGLTETQRQKLLESGELSRYFSGNENPVLAPNSTVAATTIADMKGIDATIGVEVVFRTPIPPQEIDMLKFANILLSFSRLQGLHYYSASRDAMRLLFEISHTADPADYSHAIPDTIIGELPASRSAMLFQHDLTFGDNVYQTRLDASEQQIHLQLLNLTPYRYGPIRLIKEGNMRMDIYLVRSGDGLDYYGVFGAKSINFSLLKKKIRASFYNRLAALYRWFDATRTTTQ